MQTSDQILTIETSTSACSVALQLASGKIVHRRQVGSNVHSQVLLPMVQQVLDEGAISMRDVQAIGVSRGPGSFTGLRIGIGVAQGLAYGAKKPMFGYTSLEVLIGQQLERKDKQLEPRDKQLEPRDKQLEPNRLIVAALDARMNEVYWGVYQLQESIGHWPSLVGSQAIKVSPPSSVILDSASSIQVVALGNAWTLYPELARQLDSHEVALPSPESELELLPHAIGLIQLYNIQQRAMPEELQQSMLMPADFRPLYVRDNVASKPVAKQHGLSPNKNFSKD